MLPSIFEKYKIYLNRTESLLIINPILSAKNEDFAMKRPFLFDFTLLSSML